MDGQGRPLTATPRRRPRSVTCATLFLILLVTVLCPVLVGATAEKEWLEEFIELSRDPQAGGR